MKVLFLSHYFPPEVNAPATRTYEHCKVWVEQGHDVTVVSCVPHHPMGRAYPGYRNRFYQVEYKEGIRIVRVLTYITANEGFIKRTFNYIVFMLASILLAPFLAKADVVVSTSPQFFNGLAGYFVSRIKRAKWVLEIRDLWPESIVAVGALKNAKAVRVLEWIERFVYRKADHIVPVTRAFKQHIVNCGADEEKVTVVRNGVDLGMFGSDTQYDLAFARELGIEGKFVAAYVGTHGMAHGLEVILDAAESLLGVPEIVFLMVGEGAEREKLLGEKERRKLSNVIMLGQQPKADMPKIWSVTNVSLVLLRKLDIFKTVIPSKIFESMAMGRPIILGVEGEVADIIDESGAGVCIEPESAEALVVAVRELQSNKDRYQRLSTAGRPFVTSNFDRTALAKTMLSVIESQLNEQSKQEK